MSVQGLDMEHSMLDLVQGREKVTAGGLYRFQDQADLGGVGVMWMGKSPDASLASRQPLATSMQLHASTPEIVPTVFLTEGPENASTP